MITPLLCLFAVLMPGLAISTYADRKLEHTLPVSCTITVGFLFPFGLAGRMNIGVAAELIISAFLLVLTLFRVGKRNEWKKLAGNVLTSGMAWFAIAFLVLSFGIRGKLFDQWDEFSHWGDVVKATVDLNGFSTNSASMSAFQTYPPGMVIFQYLFQRIGILTGGPFREWGAYFSYNLFLLCFFAPLFSKLSLKKPLRSLASLVCILALPTAFYTKTWFSLYIDVAVSCVFAYGLYSIVKSDEKDTDQTNWLQILSVCSACFMLPMLKDAGIFFAIALLLMFLCTQKWKAGWKGILAVAISAILPILAWKINVRISGATEVFPMQFDLRELGRVILGRGAEYRGTVLEEYVPTTLISKTFVIGNTGLAINYLMLMVIVSVAAYFMLQKQANQTVSIGLRRIGIAIPVLFVVYTGGLLITYMFQFSEYEALRYSAFERYISMPLCGICCFLLYILLDNLQSKRRIWIAILTCAVLLVAPLENAYHFLNRDYVSESVKSRSEYTQLADKIHRDVPESATVYIISQQDNGADFWVMHYLCRPARVNIGQLSEKTGFSGFQAGGYSIGGPYTNNDIWSANISPETLMDEWVSRYDYVAVLHTNDYLNETFAPLFDGKLMDNGLYQIDKENRTARLVQ